MPDLIIGHTGETTVQVWVCGDTGHRGCTVTLQPEGKHRHVRLPRDADRTAIACFKDLTPDTEYTVSATFGPMSTKSVTGRFRTFPRQLADQRFDFSFVLSSCNLPVISITNLLSYLLAYGGTSAAVSSLNLPVASWRYSKVVLLRRLRLLRWLMKAVVYYVAKLVTWWTGLKQPPPPFLRSPFLKLVAVFDARMLEVRAEEGHLPSVGDAVGSRDARGVLACAPTEAPPPKPRGVDQNNGKSGKGNGTTGGDAGREKDGHKKEGDGKARNWRLVLTQVTGEFAEGEGLFRRIPVKGDTEQKPIGPIVRAERCHPWYGRPSFFIHAGDQIYYDFPTEKRRPDSDQYRLAYREAWFDDPSSRYLLSHWPHYMTLDDHEIADQFSRDFKPPQKEIERGLFGRYFTRFFGRLFKRPPRFEDVAKPREYLTHSMAAYDDYVYGRHPEEDRERAEKKDTRRLWYEFDKGSTQFFVLDTRTQRIDGRMEPAQIIDREQMDALLQWMSRHKDALKFVVTSVPFVAEISDEGSEQAPTWTGQGEAERAAHRPRNPANDKWSADRFRAQRDRIINYIYDNKIERLIFLTGDMHCCYHATMRIGTGSKYASVVVHELAGGPVNQLQLANEVEFHTTRTGRPWGRGENDNVLYEVNLDQFHSQMNGVVHVKVNYVEREQVQRAGRAPTPEVAWNVIRTLVDDGPEAWTWTAPEDENGQGKGDSEDKGRSKPKGGKPVMQGLITFSPKRELADLLPL